MQVQAQHHPFQKVSFLEFKANVQKRNTAWFSNIHPIASNEEKLEAFEDIDN